MAPLDDFNALFDGWEHHGMRAELVRAADPNDRSALWHLIHPAAGIVAQTRQELKRDAQRRWYVELHSLHAAIPRPTGPRGIGRSLWAYERDALRKYPVHRVQLRADDVGCYLWAAVGFVFAANGEPLDPVRARRRMRLLLDDASKQARLAEWRAIAPAVVDSVMRRTSPGCPAADALWRPQQLASIRGPMPDRHFGREMLHDNEWTGVFLLS